MAAIGCGSPQESTPPQTLQLDWGPHASELPTLVTILDTEPPPPAMVGVSGLAADGSVVVGTDRTGPDLLAVVDTSNQLIMTFGKSGTGPGEMQMVMWRARTANGFVAFGMRQLKLVVFDTTGAPVKDLRRQGNSIMNPRFMIDDSTVFVVIPGHNGGMNPAVMSLATGETTTLIPASDSFMSRFNGPDGNPDFTHIPTFGRWLGGLLVADGRDYQLGLYDWEGHLQQVIKHVAKRPTMTLAKANEELASLNSVRKPLTGAALDRERDRLMDKARPYFLPATAPNFDDQGRLWILGQAGDSAYADLFGRDGFVGRMPLSCQGFDRTWRLKGHWLALICTTSNPDSRSGRVMKLLRITG